MVIEPIISIKFSKLLLDYLKRQKLLRKPVLRAKDTRLLLIRILEKKYYKFLKCGSPALLPDTYRN
jgi:hypothetical protein